jgi:hypothetical protein
LLCHLADDHQHPLLDLRTVKAKRPEPDFRTATRKEIEQANTKELKQAVAEYALAHPEIKVSSADAGRGCERASPQDSHLASGLPK